MSGESGRHSCLVLDLSRKAFEFFTVNIMLVVAILQIFFFFYQIQAVPLYFQFTERFLS